MRVLTHFDLVGTIWMKQDYSSSFVPLRPVCVPYKLVDSGRVNQGRDTYIFLVGTVGMEQDYSSLFVPPQLVVSAVNWPILGNRPENKPSLFLPCVDG